MVAIKNFEMPSYCLWDCPLAREDGGACQLVDIKTSDKERPKDCPLVEIGTCKDCKQLGVMDCGYYCKLNHWGKISTESNYGGMGDFYCADFEKRGDKV